MPSVVHTIPGILHYPERRHAHLSSRVLHSSALVRRRVHGGGGGAAASAPRVHPVRQLVPLRTPVAQARPLLQGGRRAGESRAARRAGECRAARRAGECRAASVAANVERTPYACATSHTCRACASHTPAHAWQAGAERARQASRDHSEARAWSDMRGRDTG
jgi:hypothetical protein